MKAQQCHARIQIDLSIQNLFLIITYTYCRELHQDSLY